MKATQKPCVLSVLGFLSRRHLSSLACPYLLTNFIYICMSLNKIRVSTFYQTFIWDHTYIQTKTRFYLHKKTLTKLPFKIHYIPSIYLYRLRVALHVLTGNWWEWKGHCSLQHFHSYLELLNYVPWDYCQIGLRKLAAIEWYYIKKYMRQRFLLYIVSFDGC